MEMELEFFEACYEGNLQKVKELCNKLVDLNWSNPSESRAQETSFHWACAGRRKEVVEYLLRLPGIDVNKENKNGFTPLHIVCGNGAVEILNMMFASGKRFDTTKRTKITASTGNVTAAEFARKKGKTDIAELVDEYARDRRAV